MHILLFLHSIRKIRERILEMEYENYGKIIGVIEDIVRGEDCCSQMISVQTENGPVNLIVAGDTQVIGNMKLRRGMRIAAFYDTNLATPAIYPPQYRATLVTSLRRGQNVVLQYFDRDLTAQDQSLRLNVGPKTTVTTANGQNYPCNPSNQVLFVYYTTTTFSIPPMTTPEKIIVMCPK